MDRKRCIGAGAALNVHTKSQIVAHFDMRRVESWQERVGEVDVQPVCLVLCSDAPQRVSQLHALPALCHLQAVALVILGTRGRV
jgi:hypothetical protein